MEGKKIHNLWETTPMMIDWIDWNARQLAGIMSPPPAVGDILRARMSSGTIARFEVLEVITEDTHFFIQASDIGYEEETK